jgi:hypothetical protein
VHVVAGCQQPKVRGELGRSGIAQAANGRAHQVPALVQAPVAGRLLAHGAQDGRAQLPVAAGLGQRQRLHEVRLGERGPRPAGVRQVPGEERGLGRNLQQLPVDPGAAPALQEAASVRAQEPDQRLARLPGARLPGRFGRLAGGRAQAGYVAEADLRPGCRSLFQGAGGGARIDEQPAHRGVAPHAAFVLVAPGEVVGQVRPPERRYLRRRMPGSQFPARLGLLADVSQHAAGVGAEPAAGESG